MPLLLALAAAGLTGTAPIPAKVDHVWDGDTIWVLAQGRKVKVRLLDIDCPESTRNPKCLRGGVETCEAELPLGHQATLRAKELLPAGTAITLEPQVTKRKQIASFPLDGYRRVLAHVRLADGREFEDVMLGEGLCRKYRTR